MSVVMCRMECRVDGNGLSTTSSTTERASCPSNPFPKPIFQGERNDL